MNNWLKEQSRKMRLFMVGLRVGFVAAVMVTTVPMIAYTQTTEPVIESRPAAVDTNPARIGNSMATDAPAQTGSLTKSGIPAAVDVEIQSRFNELRRELLDDRANTIDWWLAVTALVLTFFGIVVAIAGFLGFRRFREIETEAKKSAAAAAKSAEDAQYRVKEIEKNWEKSEKMTGEIQELRGMNAVFAGNNPNEMRQAARSVPENSEPSLTDKAIRLNPDDDVAYFNRGNSKATLADMTTPSPIIMRQSG